MQIGRSALRYLKTVINRVIFLIYSNGTAGTTNMYVSIAEKLVAGAEAPTAGELWEEQASQLMQLGNELEETLRRSPVTSGIQFFNTIGEVAHVTHPTGSGGAAHTHREPTPITAPTSAPSTARRGHWLDPTCWADRARGATPQLVISLQSSSGDHF
eukprot:SAG31_NODE_1791_length_7258_cov_12.040928_8_plen_157_part_00